MLRLDDVEFEGVCPRCNGGVDDMMPWCPWCGRDAAGTDLLGPVPDRVAGLLAQAGVGPLEYRVLLRPGVSGVDPDYPTIVEINRGLVVPPPNERHRWETLAGLIVHELGHVFQYRHVGWARSEPFRRLFGDVDSPYRVPDTVEVDFGDARFHPTLPDRASHYGAYHPQEEFAETFRFYVLLGGRLDALADEAARTAKAAVVLDRFRFLDSFLRREAPGLRGSEATSPTAGS